MEVSRIASETFVIFCAGFKGVINGFRQPPICSVAARTVYGHEAPLICVNGP